MTAKSRRTSSWVRKVIAERGWGGLVRLHESDSRVLMATILRLPYTTAIRLSLRGGLLYGLPCLCPIAACTLLPQCAKSTMYHALPSRTRCPALCRHNPERRGHAPQRQPKTSPNVCTSLFALPAAGAGAALRGVRRARRAACLAVARALPSRGRAGTAGESWGHGRGAERRRWVGSREKWLVE